MNDTNQKRIRVAGYVRVSTEKQVEGESPRLQKDSIEKYCHANDWNLVTIEEDLGISGHKSDNRPGWQKVMSMADSGEIDVVVCLKLSRIARNTLDALSIEQELRLKNVALVSLREKFDTTNPSGKLNFQMLSMIAEFEREVIREQMSENKIRKWREKRMFTGHAPYGYFWDKKACEFREEVEESALLNKMFDWYTNLGFSMREIVERMNREGYRSRRSKWTHGTVGGIFKNPCYGSCKLHTNTRKYEDGKRTKTLKSEEEWITFDLPRIVTKSLCDKVEQRRAFNLKKQKRTLWQQEHWLRGSLKCGRCGGQMRVRKGNSRVDGSFTRYYICHWSCCSTRDLKLENRIKCEQGNIPSDQLEQYVWDDICFRITGSHADPATEEALQNSAAEQFSFLTGGNVDERIASLGKKIDRLTQEKERKERAKGRLFDMLEDEEVDLSGLRSKLRDNDQAIATLIEELRNAEGDKLELLKLFKDQESYNNSRELLFDIWGDLQDFEPEDKQRLLESLVPDGVTVVISPNPNPGKADFKRLGKENVIYDLVWNPTIFQYFEDTGRFPSLCRNSPDNSSGYDIR